MSYHFSKILDNITFDNAISYVTEALKKEGFGVLTTIDIKATLKKKLDADIQDYTILGACNPAFAHEAIQAEKNIGVFLPCNVLVQKNEDGAIEVSAVDPISSMMAVKNEALGGIAIEVQQKIKRVINSL